MAKKKNTKKQRDRWNRDRARRQQRRQPANPWPALGTHPPQGSYFAVPVFDYANFLEIFKLPDHTEGKVEWDTWQEQLQEWYQLLKTAGYRTIDIVVTGSSYADFLEDTQMADDQLALWSCAANRAVPLVDEIVHSLGSLLVSTVDLAQFPFIGGAAADEPTAGITVDSDTGEVRLSLLMTDPEKPEAPWEFSDLDVLDLSDMPAESVQRLKNGEVPWYGGMVYEDSNGEWMMEFYMADTEDELQNALWLGSIRRVLERLGERGKV